MNHSIDVNEKEFTLNSNFSNYKKFKEQIALKH